jgi:hypothetical protein
MTCPQPLYAGEGNRPIGRKKRIIMETRTYKVYKFDELTEEQQQKAVEGYYDFNVDQDWWEFVYDDAANVGLKITGFDTERECTGNFVGSAKATAKAILANHGKTCDTYKTAARYYIERVRIIENVKRGKRLLGVGRQLKSLDDDFLYSLLEDYRSLLRKDYDYQTSDEAIRESLVANDYWFTEDGKINS